MYLDIIDTIKLEIFNNLTKKEIYDLFIFYKKEYLNNRNDIFLLNETNFIFNNYIHPSVQKFDKYFELRDCEDEENLNNIPWYFFNPYEQQYKRSFKSYMFHIIEKNKKYGDNNNNFIFICTIKDGIKYLLKNDNINRFTIIERKKNCYFFNMFIRKMTRQLYSNSRTSLSVSDASTLPSLDFPDDYDTGYIYFE